jgi:putative transposase
LLSIVCRLARCLLGLLTVLARSDLSEDAEPLVLRPREPGAAPSADRLSAVGSRRPCVVCGVVAAGEPPPLAGDLPGHPATILRWYCDLIARKWDYASRRRPGRPPTGTSVKTLIIRMARENPA